MKYSCSISWKVRYSTKDLENKNVKTTHHLERRCYSTQYLRLFCVPFSRKDPMKEHDYFHNFCQRMAS